METTTINNETAETMLKDLGIGWDQTSNTFNNMAEAQHRFLKDTRINVNNALKFETLAGGQAELIAYAIATNAKHQPLAAAFKAKARATGISDEWLTDTDALVSLMNVNNVFYRFRHYMDGNEYYENTPAGIKMNIMMNPAMGKELFELISLAVSAANGCERCVTSHEASVRHAGASQQKVYEAIRLTAIIQGLIKLV